MSANSESLLEENRLLLMQLKAMQAELELYADECKSLKSQVMPDKSESLEKIDVLNRALQPSVLLDRLIRVRGVKSGSRGNANTDMKLAAEHAADENYKMLKTRYENSVSKLASESRTNQNLQTKLESLQAELDQERGKTHALQEDLESNRSQLDQECGKTRALQEDLESNRSKLDQECGKTRALQENLESNRSKLDQECGKTRALQEDLESVRSKLDREYGKTHTLQANLKSTQSKLDMESSKSLSLQAEMESLQSNNEKGVLDKRGREENYEMNLTNRLNLSEQKHRADMDSLSNELNKKLANAEEDYKRALMTLSGECEGLKNRIRDQSSLAEHQKVLVSNMTAETNKIRQDFTEVAHERRLNLKMLAKSQIDLNDLQEKYAEKLEREKFLVELLSELREKLLAASQFYFTLKDSHPEIVSNE